MDDRRRRARVVCSLLGAACVLGAALLMLLPIPPQDLGVLNGPLYCGPGASSDNALQIMLNPDDVNQDPPPRTQGQSADDYARERAAASARNIQVCQGPVKTRFVWAMGLVILAVAVGLAVPSILLALPYAGHPDYREEFKP